MKTGGKIKINNKTMKKTCLKCKALEDIGNNISKYVCELGFLQDAGIPLEKCPKPLTTKKFVQQLQLAK